MGFASRIKRYNTKKQVDENVCEKRWIISNYKKKNEKMKFARMPVLMRSHAISS